MEFYGLRWELLKCNLDVKYGSDLINFEFLAAYDGVRRHMGAVYGDWWCINVINQNLDLRVQSVL